jgi:hypothetical protein
MPTIPRTGLLGNRIVLGVVGAIAALVVIVIGLALLSSNRTHEPKTASESSVASDKHSTGVTRSKVWTESSIPGAATMKDADEATVKAVNKALGKFVGLLNWDRRDQAYTFLSDELRNKLTREQFRRKFFSSPRLWKLKVLKIGRTSDGKVLVKLQCRIADAYSGTSRTLTGWIGMAEQGTTWKIVDISIG